MYSCKEQGSAAVAGVVAGGKRGGGGGGGGRLPRVKVSCHRLTVLAALFPEMRPLTSFQEFTLVSLFRRLPAKLDSLCEHLLFGYLYATKYFAPLAKTSLPIAC